MGKRTVEIARFIAMSAEGREFELVAYQDMIDASSREGVAEVAGLKQIKSRVGPVNYLAKGRYFLVNLNLEVTSDSPDAA